MMLMRRNVQQTAHSEKSGDADIRQGFHLDQQAIQTATASARSKYPPGNRKAAGAVPIVRAVETAALESTTAESDA